MASVRHGERAVVVSVVVFWGLVAVGQEFGGGTGEPNAPYLIYTAEQMNQVGARPETWNGHFELMADIDLGAYGGDTYNLIGSEEEPFTGVFDGNGHTLSRFTYVSEEAVYVGLFGLVSGSNTVIKNLGLIDPNVDAVEGLAVGALASELFCGTVTNCYVRGGCVRGRAAVGGLVGECSSGHIVDCYASAAVVGESLVGGLAGWNTGIVIQCYAAGSVVGSADTGGLLGASPGMPGKVFQSFWDMDVSGWRTSAGGEGRATAQMQAASTYAGWGHTAEGTWTIDEGNDYPRLSWERQPGQVVPSTQLADLLEGGGTQNDPFLIHTADEFNLIALFPRDWDKHFRLVADLDLSPYAATGFSPIGYYRDYVINRPFTGVFDGGGHAIANATYRLELASSHAVPLPSTGNVGLFGYVDDPNARIIALELVTPEIEAGYLGDVGALIGRLGQGTVSECSLRDGFVSGKRSVGGLVGNNVAGTIQGCDVNVVVEGFGWQGGMQGGGLGGLTGWNSGIVANCRAVSQISGREDLGGLIGANGHEGVCSNCCSAATVSGYMVLGGLVGRNSGSIKESYSEAVVSGTTGVGGLLGYNLGRVTDCYAVAEVSGDTDVAGLVGFASAWRAVDDVTITNCFSAGSVRGSSRLGGFLGFSFDGAEVLQSFWDVETSGQTTSAGGVGKTTAELQTGTTFAGAGWDFETIWMLCEGEDYPHLQWEGVGCAD